LLIIVKSSPDLKQNEFLGPLSEMQAKLVIKLDITDNQCCTVTFKVSGQAEAGWESDRKTATRVII
jgi:hypothetical protein